MNFEIVGMIFQATATVATILTIFYLANQIRLNNKLAVSSIEHHLNTRVYERRFVTARDNDFCDLIIHSVAICGQFTDEFCELFTKLRDTPDEAWSVGQYKYSGSGFEPRLNARTNIWVGGNSKAARRRTARWGDAWQPTGLTVNAMREGITELGQLCMEAERDPAQIEIGLRLRIRPTPDASPQYIGDLLGPYIDLGVTDFLLEINTRERQRALDSIDRVVASAQMANLMA